MYRLPLTPEQAELSDRIYHSLRQAAEADLRQVADLLASKPDRQLLGPTEFEVRDLVHSSAASTPRRPRRNGPPTLARSEIDYPGGRRGLIETLYAATGFLLVRRQVFLEVQRRQQLPTCFSRGAPPTIPFFLPMVIPSGGGYDYLGEDYAFCKRARRCGFQIFADTSIRHQHIGIYGYSWEDVGGGLPRYCSYRLRMSGGQEPAQH